MEILTDSFIKLRQLNKVLRFILLLHYGPLYSSSDILPLFGLHIQRCAHIHTFMNRHTKSHDFLQAYCNT